MAYKRKIQKEKKIKQKDAEVNEEIATKGVFIHLTTY